MEVGDDVAELVPDEAGARALRHARDVAIEEVAHVLRRRDVDDRRADALEHADRVALVGRERTSRHDRSRLHYALGAGDGARLRRG